MRAMNESTISPSNLELIEENYLKWKASPESVGVEWSAFFEGFELGLIRAEREEAEEERAAASLSQLPEPAKPDIATSAPAKIPEQALQAEAESLSARAGLPHGAVAHGQQTPGAAPAAPCEEVIAEGLFQRQVDMLIYAYRDLGHTLADIDPLAQEPRQQPLLDLKEFGFTEADLDRKVSSKYYLRGETVTLRELIAALRRDYASTLGVEFMYIQDPRVRHWVREQVERRHKRQWSREELIRLLSVLIEAEAFEHFLHRNYVGQKRFSLEGAESLMVALDTLLQRSPSNGVEEIVMGMAHRGRLNVLANFLNKSPRVIFSEFSENYIPDMVGGDGDVKYHLGYECIRETLDGSKVEIRLAANPSHLEAVDPVVQGKARARQRIRQDTVERKKVLPLLIHGDAAFAGQGIVSEVFNMSQLPGYRTGGTLHIIVNNQIGFTTLPADARSTSYATDVAKMIEAPILHVNGDDPVAVAFAAELAIDFRQRFGRDVVIDIVCYRRHGHNEGDEPVFTQPRLYKIIAEHPSVSRIFRGKLISEGVLTEAEADALDDGYLSDLDAALEEVRKLDDGNGRLNMFVESSAVFQPPYSHAIVQTGIRREALEKIVKALTTVPEGFRVVPKVQRILLDRRRKVFAEGGPYEWSFAESIAFGSLLIEGTAVRLSGQDSRRGTFSQRHSVLYDEETRERYIPLMHIDEKQERFCVYNSLLSEAAVLGFDYGYSLDYPSMLCIWEAQFGDFANGAQVIIDQFIVSAESKWQRPSGLVMLLPHGYEGQGPEHSSARIERFLQLCADNNIQVCNPTTAAQYFHLLRRQTKRPFRKPLIIMTPKSLLRLPEAMSMEADFTSGCFREILDDPAANRDAVRKLIFCSGKVFYDLDSFRKEHGCEDTALIRIEQLYPFHDDMLLNIAGRYPNAVKHVWCQEEPQNMGAWSHIGLVLCTLLDREIYYVGRDPSASPAEGSLARHKRRQRQILEKAFSL